LKNSTVRGDMVYMRRTFFDLLKNSKVDVNFELQKLNNLFIQDCCFHRRKSYSLHDLVAENFAKYYKRREHFLSLQELLNAIYLECFDISEFDKYFLYAEMYVDLISMLDNLDNQEIESQKNIIKTQIERVISSLGYKFIVIDDRQIIVENNVFANEAAQAVTAFADIKEALSILEYNHFSNKGNIERKKEILKKIADLLEPWRKPLNKSSELKDLLKANNDKIQALEKLFYMYNKFNIRHNNEDQMLTGLSNQEIESWYDKIYTMSLFVILGKDVAKILADFNKFVN
jgi:conserved domain protein